MTAGSTQEPQNAAIKSRVTGSTHDLAADTPTSRLDHVPAVGATHPVQQAATLSRSWDLAST
jgi:hypothetical protein